MQTHWFVLAQRSKSFWLTIHNRSKHCDPRIPAIMIQVCYKTHYHPEREKLFSCDIHNNNEHIFVRICRKILVSTSDWSAVSSEGTKSITSPPVVNWYIFCLLRKDVKQCQPRMRCC